MDYRHLARIHHKNAEDELAANSDQRLKYAALELRMAMECLTYDRALAYKDEFPPHEYETWQPRKVMAVLLEIDPVADKDCSLAFGVEEQYGVPAPKMNSLGSEKVLSMSLLRKHYDALGSYLHVQSMKQARDGVVVDCEKLRVRCEEIAAFVGDVLSSPIFNVAIGNFATLKCVECESPIRKRIVAGQREVLVGCHHCKATYTVTDEGDGKSKWTPHRQEVNCANPNCREKTLIWHGEFEVGSCWKCKGCNGENTFVLTVSHEAASG